MSKRAILSYLFTLGVIIFCFSAVYYFDYSRMKDEQRQKALQESAKAETSGFLDNEVTEGSGDAESNCSAGSNQEISDEFSDPSESSAENHLQADAVNELRTNFSMLYVVGQYDWITGIVTETVGKFPEELIGLTRQELLVYLHDHPEYGTLLSFSEHSVYLRKNDDADWSEYTYYLILEENGLMVYYLDQSTLYLDTGIKAEELSKENRELLESGFYIKDTADLFDYLQTVTS